MYGPSYPMSEQGITLPSWVGYIGSTTDALVLIEGCLRGVIPWITERPGEGSRSLLARNGNVFIYNKSSGMVRWTDGLTWSPSRVNGNFLLYRELEKQTPSGKRDPQQRKKQFIGRQRQTRSHGGIDNVSDLARPNAIDGDTDDTETKLFGPLIRGYIFKVPGLMKKTISLEIGNEKYYLISYYQAGADGAGAVRQLCRPSCSPILRHLSPREELLQGLRSRAQLQDDADERLLGEHVRLIHHPPLTYQAMYNGNGGHQVLPAQNPQPNPMHDPSMVFPSSGGTIAQANQFYFGSAAGSTPYANVQWNADQSFTQAPQIPPSYVYPFASKMAAQGFEHPLDQERTNA